MFTISRGQKSCRKNSRSTPTTTTTSTSTYSAMAACRPTASFYYPRRNGATAGPGSRAAPGGPGGREHRQCQQFVGGRCGQGRVLPGSESTEAVPGLRRDDDTRTAWRDDVPELLQDRRRSVPVDGEDDLGRGLARRDGGRVDVQIIPGPKAHIVVNGRRNPSGRRVGRAAAPARRRSAAARRWSRCSQ